MANELKTITFGEMDAVSVADWIARVRKAIDEAERVIGFRLEEVTLELAAPPSATLKFKRFPAARISRRR